MPPLSNAAIKRLKAGSKPRKYSDEGGLYIEVSPTGGKYWRMKYRFQGKEKRLSFGEYPEITLSLAREKRREAKAILNEGKDPSKSMGQKKRVQLVDKSFESVSRAWLEIKKNDWVADHWGRNERRLEKHIFPYIGKMDITEVGPVDILECCERVCDDGHIETAHRVLGMCSKVCRYGVAKRLIPSDPCRDLKDALPKADDSNHHSAVTDPEQLGPLLKMIDGYTGTLTVCCALKLAPLVFVRPGELRKAKKSQFNFAKAQWEYIASKTNPQHIVPLSAQAIEILETLSPHTQDSEYVFPGLRSSERPMSENTINAALRRMGIPKEEMCGHGFRATARTILDEVLGFRPDIIDHQLAHAVRDANGRAYNRTAHLPHRKDMMQQWADYLDSLKK